MIEKLDVLNLNSTVTISDGTGYNNNGWVTYTYPHQIVPQRTDGACPTCGHCNHCGRGGSWGQPYYPYWTYDQPFTISGVGSRTTVKLDDFCNGNATATIGFGDDLAKEDNT